MGYFLWQGCYAGFRQARALLVLERLPRHSGYACPSCQVAPPSGPLGLCPACGHRYDPFLNAGVCPHCATARPLIPCALCAAEHPLPQWETIPRSRPGDPPIIDV
jgi:hypothetical protein